ncbi:hypothetical protein [Ponticaulis sp.]|uniref:hypothetical protein n=1 Tax=Ponticaulis sp. TaxID=2020902 RepID=UPI000B75E635|nr:hypothetical protein [Ponticaulis sp.]MAI89890.1 hypothetical protein [Ponticaulis sp.]OUX99562.1 MAG: hypothetical protein CBB65_05570 [Hyphomonadaceae bacterium TMED5]|tara:strand:- start:124745 stop:126388 length:1644 start_codon:yes stop_codon:yes gene_type:complete
MKSPVKHLMAACATFLVPAIGASSAHALGPDEYTPPAENLLQQVQSMTGTQANLIRTSLENLTRQDGGLIGPDDRVRGITMTATGRIVLSISRELAPNASADECRGLLVFSDTIDAQTSLEELTWTAFCPTAIGMPSWEAGSIQATGEVVAVGTRGMTLFYKIERSDYVTHFDHLTLYHEMSGERNVETSYSAGLVFNDRDNRFYTISAVGWAESRTVTARLCRTQATDVLAYHATRFGECTEFEAPVSGQGANLIMDFDGKMYLVSAFSGDGFYPDLSGRTPTGRQSVYAASCVLPPREWTAQDDATVQMRPQDMFEDILRVSEIEYSDFDNTSARDVFTADIGSAEEDDICVHERPSFRHAGGVSLQTNGNMLGLWAGSGVDEDGMFEFAVQPLSVSRPDELNYTVGFDCSVGDLTNEWTTSTLTATLYSLYWEEVGQASISGPGQYACDMGEPTIDVAASARADHVKITTSGDDGFMIDRVSLYSGGDEIAEFLAGDGRGWCLSTDPGDANGPWLAAALTGCETEHVWSLSDLRVQQINSQFQE